MKKTMIAALVSLFAVVGAHAAAPLGAVTTSTDPAKAAAVEHHAHELQMAQSAKPMPTPVVHSQKKAVKHHKHRVSRHAAAKK